MFEIFKVIEVLSKEEEIDILLNDSNQVCKELFDGKTFELDFYHYRYSTAEAIEELGLEEELIHQLTEDYVIQILKSIPQFQEYINKLRVLNSNIEQSDYQPLRDLAHKNLGVARNLRIKDGEKLLFILMKSDSLQHLEITLKALESCAIRLNPECAYDTLKLLEVKNSF